jgi:hypothetical protein
MPSLMYIPATATSAAYTFYTAHTHTFFCDEPDCENEVEYNGDFCESCLINMLSVHFKNDMPVLETYCPDCKSYSVLEDDESCPCELPDDMPPLEFEPPPMETYCEDCRSYSVLEDDECCACMPLDDLNIARLGGPCLGCGMPGMHENDICAPCMNQYYPTTP